MPHVVFKMHQVTSPVPWYWGNKGYTVLSFLLPKVSVPLPQSSLAFAIIKQGLPNIPGIGCIGVHSQLGYYFWYKGIKDFVALDLDIYYDSLLFKQ